MYSYEQEDWNWSPRRADAAQGPPDSSGAGGGQVPPGNAPDEQEAGVEPYFPTPDEAVELNQEVHRLDGQPAWGGVVKPNELESAINRAQQHWAYGPEADDAERLAAAGAKLAYGVGMNQPFADGNKRTAAWLARHFLDQNGLGHISPLDFDDEEFADHLIGHGAKTHSEADTIGLFKQRNAKGRTASRAWDLEPLWAE